MESTHTFKIQDTIIHCADKKKLYLDGMIINGGKLHQMNSIWNMMQKFRTAHLVLAILVVRKMKMARTGLLNQNGLILDNN